MAIKANVAAEFIADRNAARSVPVVWDSPTGYFFISRARQQPHLKDLCATFDFRRIGTSMKTPTLIAAIKADLAAGHAVVIQIVSTGEALMERRLSDIPADE